MRSLFTPYLTHRNHLWALSSHRQICMQWRKQDAQAIKDDIRTYMDMHEDTARWLAEGKD